MSKVRRQKPSKAVFLAVVALLAIGVTFGLRSRQASESGLERRSVTDAVPAVPEPRTDAPGTSIQPQGAPGRFELERPPEEGPGSSRAGLHEPRDRPDRRSRSSARDMEAEQPGAVRDDREPVVGEPADRNSDEEPATLAFLVLDGDEATLSGASVTVSGESRSHSTTAERSGWAVFEGLAPGHYTYIVRAADRPPLSSASPITLASGDDTEIELRLPAYDRSVSGRVIDQEGRSVPGLGVSALQRSVGIAGVQLAPAKVPTTVTHRDGSFTVTALAEGEIELRTVATDVYPSASTLVRPGADRVILEVVENRDFRLVGSVTDRSGQPLAGVTVVPIGHSGGPVSTDDGGNYELPLVLRLLEGAYAVSFRLAGYEEQRFTLRGEDVASQQDVLLDVELVPIERSVELLGRLADDRGDEVPGEVVHLHSPTTQTRYQARSGDDGWFRFAEVSASRDYSLSVRPRARYHDLTLEELDLSVEPSPLEVVLRSLPTARVRGVMVTQTGDPVPGFRLLLRNAQALAQQIEVVSDGAGYFDLLDVPAGSVHFQTRSLPRFRFGVLELEAGADESVELVLDVGSRVLEGAVVDRRGEPVTGARVALEWELPGALRSESHREALTDRAGSFRFSGFGAGEHRVVVEAAGLGRFELAAPESEPWMEIRLEGSVAPGSP